MNPYRPVRSSHTTKLVTIPAKIIARIDAMP